MCVSQARDRKRRKGGSTHALLILVPKDTMAMCVIFHFSDLEKGCQPGLLGSVHMILGYQFNGSFGSSLG